MGDGGGGSDNDTPVDIPGPTYPFPSDDTEGVEIPPDTGGNSNVPPPDVPDDEGGLPNLDDVIGEILNPNPPFDVPDDVVIDVPQGPQEEEEAEAPEEGTEVPETGPLEGEYPPNPRPDVMTDDDWRDVVDAAPEGEDPLEWLEEFIRVIAELEKARREQEGVEEEVPETEAEVPDVDTGDLDSADDPFDSLVGDILGGVIGTDDPLSGIPGAAGGTAGQLIGNALFGTDATQSFGSSAGAGVGTFVLGPGFGTVVGAVLGGILDSAFGTSDQQNVTLGVATTRPGDDLVQETQAPSGLTLYTIGRRVDDTAATDFHDTLFEIDRYLTTVAEQYPGVEIALRNDNFGGEVQGKGKNLMANPTFFGSATEGKGETNRNSVGRNLDAAVEQFITSWLEAAGPNLPPEVQDAVAGLSGNSQQLLAGFAQAMEPPDAELDAVVEEVLEEVTGPVQLAEGVEPAEPVGPNLPPPSSGFRPIEPEPSAEQLELIQLASEAPNAVIAQGLLNGTFTIDENGKYVMA